jgi:hypothetical protein
VAGSPRARRLGGDDLRLLEIDFATSFALCSEGRIERENDPERSPGPRMAFAGCDKGNRFALRSDVGPSAAAAIWALAEAEPPWRDGAAAPACLPAILDLLAAEARIETIVPGLVYRLPNALAFDGGARIVAGNTIEGAALSARLDREGLPASLLAMGFSGPADFWPPWCAALVDGEIASVAFAARLGRSGAEIGVAAAPEHRAKGLAAAVTAAWSALPSLAGHVLFYSTQTTNLSSRGVAARLHLRLIGPTLRVT